MLHSALKSVNPPHSKSSIVAPCSSSTVGGKFPAFPCPLPSSEGGVGVRPGRPESPLGIIRKSRNRPSEETPTKTASKYQRQDKARFLVASKSLESCCRTPIAGRGSVQVFQSGDKMSFGGLMTCGSVWQCPVCASKVTEKRRAELKIATDVWKLNGGQVVMATLTVPHYYNDNLQDLLDNTSLAFRRLTNNRAWKEAMKQAGIVYRIRCLEVTHGGNGWHPHFHVLLFVKGQLEDVDLAYLQFDLLATWQNSCVSVGLPMPNQHGLQISSPDAAAEYVSKWGMEEEMTKGHLKQGKKEGQFAPFALLDEYAKGDEKAGELFRDYAKAFKGKRQLVWDRKLRDAVGLGQEKSDAELAEEEETEKKESVLVAIIPCDAWSVIIKNHLREDLLEALRDGGASAGRALLSLYCKNPPNLSPNETTL